MNETNRMNLAFLGTGAMGQRMAARLLAAGHRLVVHNRTKARAEALIEAGARWADTPAEAVKGADVALSMVRDDEASASMWTGDGGGLSALSEAAIAVEMSTLSPGWTRRLEAMFSECGRRMLEAPVVGTRPHAEAGTLTILVGGAAALTESARPVLEVMGEVRHVGAVGDAAALKLAINTLFATQVAVLSELLGYLRQAGLEPGRALDVLGDLPVMSPAAKAAGAGIAAARWAPLFPVELTHKDLSFTLHAAGKLGAETPITHAVQELYGRALGAGFGDENLHAVAKLYGEGPKRATRG